MCCEPRLQHACTSLRTLTQHQLIPPPPCSQEHANHRYPTSSYSYRRSIDKLSILTCSASTASSARDEEAFCAELPDAFAPSVALASLAGLVSSSTTLSVFRGDVTSWGDRSRIGSSTVPCIRLYAAVSACLDWVSGMSLGSVALADLSGAGADTLGRSAGFGVVRTDVGCPLRALHSFVSRPVPDSAGIAFFHVETWSARAVDPSGARTVRLVCVGLALP